MLSQTIVVKQKTRFKLLSILGQYWFCATKNKNVLSMVHGLY